uniref:Gfo/Idh/MocA-like oxidoreductase N-terminal domain-containing protein n=1 Tax=Odontella aurita TaxID=265563 RepID=A0A7S4K3Q2_9STRA|mmetsp:Transcript_60134/g.178302  ORF Transcript_60134/g.178302 Transcript_60134/m.178302 type:complete len:359 (+) Transcript_60134:168-1244(+)|eukprot:CAMPEP_0113537388 /NCGR_PEP_ID=MMETSP0015_2-20120614/6798_1 /TAXON_ID=2838 /ORGANISM="Odontella" /LENGTH=358 /DNA_ID=CAMNT_0000436877 /DNA_START=101 /DNA_END=1177 /DNA_ORIENTATION=- /assembly_acc=CAM_ASM_000160
MSDKRVKTISWGIVGCGTVCEVKSGPAFYNCSNSSLIAAMRRDEAKAKDYAKRHSVEKVYTSARELIDDESVDAVYVATPPGGDRIGIAKMVADTKKHVCYMEKPLGRDVNEAKEIVSILQKANVPLYVAYYRRCMPKFVAVKKALDQKKIGNITGVSVTLHQSRHLQKDKSHWHYDKEISGGGLFMDVGCHMLDLVDFFVGPIENATGRAFLSVKDQIVEDNVRGMWEHTCPVDGRRFGGSCVFNFTSGGPRRDEIEITGTLGSVVVSCFDTKPAQLKLDSGNEVVALDAKHPYTVQQPMIQLLIQDILSKTGCGINAGLDLDPDEFLCNGEAAVRTSEVLDKLLGRAKWTDDYMIT